MQMRFGMKAGLFALEKTKRSCDARRLPFRDMIRNGLPVRGADARTGVAVIAYVCRPQVALKAQLFLIAGLTTPVGTISKIMTLSRTERFRLCGAK